MQYLAKGGSLASCEPPPPHGSATALAAPGLIFVLYVDVVLFVHS